MSEYNIFIMKSFKLNEDYDVVLFEIAYKKIKTFNFIKLINR